MDQQVIETLRGRAIRIIYWMAQRAGAWRGWADSDGLDFEIMGEGHIRFHPVIKNGSEHTRELEHSYIDFSNISPKDVIRQKYRKPKLKNTHVVDVNSTVIENRSSSIEIERTYTVTESETLTINEEAGVEIGLQLRQQIGYGGAVSPVTGETEISASINAHYSRQMGTESTKGREITNTIKVPPGVVATLTTQKHISDFTQLCEYWCDLDHDVRIISFGHWVWSFESMEDLHNIILGRGFVPKNTTSDYEYPVTHFNKSTINPDTAKWIIEPLGVHYTTQVKFSNASAGNVLLKQKKTKKH